MTGLSQITRGFSPGRPEPALAVSLITSDHGLEALVPEWEGLWQRCPSATPFQSPAWLLPWWQAFAPGPLCTIAVRTADRLVGLAPFYLEAETARLLPIGISLSDYLDLLLDPLVADKAAAAIANAAAEELPGTSWCLEELSPEASAWRIPVPAGWTSTVETGAACPVLDLAGAPSLTAALPATRRRKLAMARHRMARRAETTVVEGAPHHGKALLEALFELHTARWQERDEPGVLADETVRRFHRTALEGLLAAGFLRLIGLHAAGRWIAVYYGFEHRGRMYGYLSGFDPEFAFESPGTIVLAEAMERGWRAGARAFHFLRGDESYKLGWGAVVEHNRRRVFSRLN